MIKLKKGGIYRFVEEKDVAKFKKLGFNVVEQDKPKTVKEIKKDLDDKGVEYDSDMKKDELLALLGGE